MKIKQCPKCKTDVPAMLRHCPHCGTTISSAPAAPAGNIHKTLLMAGARLPSSPPAAAPAAQAPPGQAPPSSVAPNAPTQEMPALQPAEAPVRQEPAAADPPQPPPSEPAPREQPPTAMVPPPLDDDEPLPTIPKRKSALPAIIIGALSALLVGGIAFHFFVEPIPILQRAIRSVFPPSEEEAAPLPEEKTLAENPAPVPEEPKEPETPAPPTVQGNCKAIADYPDFPWRKHLVAFVEGTKKAGLCELFGMAPKDLEPAIGEMPKLGPTGYDPFKKGTVLELFPSGRMDRGDGTIEMIFADDLLIEIRFHFTQQSDVDLKGAFSAGALSPVFGDPLSEKTDKLGRTITRFEEGDVQVDLTVTQAPPKENAGKKSKKKRAKKKEAEPAEASIETVEMAFASKLALAAIQNAIKDRQSAEASLLRAVRSLYTAKRRRSVKQLERARKSLPSLAETYLWEALLDLHDEDFKSAGKTAKKAIKASGDDRVKARAKAILSTVSAYHNKYKTATSLISEAKELDPATPEYAQSLEELESKAHTPDRVAQIAAMMTCKGKKRGKKWSAKALYARGNFRGKKGYRKALKKAKKDDTYKEALARYKETVCR